MIDTNHLPKSEKYSELPETVVIFITRYDIIGLGEPIYYVGRTVWTDLPFINEPTVLRVLRKLFDDKSHIIYVNGSYNSTETELGRLIHDFKCTDPNKMLTNLKNRMTYLKTADGGKGKMSDKFRSYFKEELEEGRKEGIEKGRSDTLDIIRMIKAGATDTDIAEQLHCTLAVVQETRAVLA